MPDSVDNDTLAAIVTRWKQVPNLPGFDRPAEAGRLKAGQQSPGPYAQLTSRLEKRQQINTRGAWWDWRRIEIIIRGGDKAAVLAAGAAVNEVFRSGVELQFPSGPTTKLMRWAQDQADRLEQEPGGESKDGYDVFRLTIGALVWTTRAQ